MAPKCQPFQAMTRFLLYRIQNSTNICAHVHVFGRGASFQTSITPTAKPQQKLNNVARHDTAGKKDEIRELRFHVTYRMITAQARQQMNSAALQRVATTKTASQHLLRKMKEDGGVQEGREGGEMEMKG